MSREWERALERHLSLIEYSKTGSAALWMDLFTRMYRDMMAPEALRKRMIDLLNTAETFYVSEDMTKLVEVASETVGDPVLESHVPFVPRGFVYFARPIRIWSLLESSVDDEGQTASLAPHHIDLKALLWTYEPASVTRKLEDGSAEAPSDGVSMFLFGSDSQLDYYVKWMATSERPDTEALTEIMTSPEGFESTIGTLAHHFGLDQFHPAPGGLTLVEAQSWAAGSRWSEIQVEDQQEILKTAGPDDDGKRTTPLAKIAMYSDLEWSGKVWFSVARVRRLVYSLWSIMAQPIAAPVTEQANRDYRRRWEREVGASPNYGDVRVVTLRRSMSGGGPTETEDEWGREWTHRWVVRGHWREQWYPSEGVHRLIWIAPFVKGPEDKPLIVKDTVFSVVR